MSQQPPPVALSLYEQDETAWLEQTALLIAQCRFDEVDHAHLSEYLTDMARRDRREVLHRVTVLLLHMLKWEHQPDQRTASWQATIRHQRQELRDLFESRTLENHAREVLAIGYGRAVQQVAAATDKDITAFPTTCPWPLEDVVPSQP
jgi:hypothetical protein